MSKQQLADGSEMEAGKRFLPVLNSIWVARFNKTKKILENRSNFFGFHIKDLRRFTSQFRLPNDRKIL